MCGVVSLDLAKAFDTVNHARLLYKLECYGFKYGARSWFDSYLSNRSQCTIVGDDLSSPKWIRCGVPQGSILGPLLFICYINDLQQHCLATKLYMYADDSALVSSNCDPEVVSECLQADRGPLHSM